MSYNPKSCEIAGFELIGFRQSDGTIRLGASPRNGLPEDHDSFGIEWGVYV